MSGERPDLDEVLRRVEELIGILKILTDDLREIVESLRVMKSQVTAPTRIERGMRTIDDVQRLFPKDLASMLYFEETSDYIIVRPRQYLGSENFAKIASIIRDQLGGEYVSAGRESHFRVSRKL